MTPEEAKSIIDEAVKSATETGSTERYVSREEIVTRNLLSQAMFRIAKLEKKNKNCRSSAKQAERRFKESEAENFLLRSETRAQNNLKGILLKEFYLCNNVFRNITNRFEFNAAEQIGIVWFALEGLTKILALLPLSDLKQTTK